MTLIYCLKCFTVYAFPFHLSEDRIALDCRVCKQETIHRQAEINRSQLVPYNKNES